MKFFAYNFGVICLLIVVTNTLFNNNVNANYKLIRNEDVIDVPLKSDLPVYLLSLRRIIDFYNRNKNEVDINVMFGLFLVNINLKRSSKSKIITEPLKRYLSEIIYENEKVINHFKFKAETDFNPQHVKDKMIMTLFSNETTWFKRLPRISLPVLPNMKFRRDTHILAKDSSWNKYRMDVDNFEKWVPNPKQSDFCLASLAENSVHKSESLYSCRLPKKCTKIMINGTNFGYALNHRLLLLLNAHYGRNCNVFSAERDRSLMNKFCSLAYEEAEYIIAHDYDIVDLILEQVCLCALQGHSEFIRRSWLTNILRFQTEHGCFGEHLDKTISIERFKPNIWKLSKLDHTLLGGECNGHVTAGAAATLSVASRFILENYK